jgi:predicted nucleotidyltransferase
MNSNSSRAASSGEFELKQDLEDLLRCKVEIVTEAALSPYIKDEVLNQAVRL